MKISNPNEDLQAMSKLSIRHQDLIKKSKTVGCYYCCTIYPSANIQEWCDDGDTALCPNCSIDSVLPDYSVVLSTKFLQELHDYYFDDE